MNTQEKALLPVARQAGREGSELTSSLNAAACPLSAERHANAPLQHRQQACRHLRRRYHQLFNAAPYSRLQRCADGRRQWQPVYSNRELALVLDLLEVELTALLQVEVSHA